MVLKLLEWFPKNARDLPWRRTRDPYAIWVSEIMLQQTRVKTVVAYWERWMRALPTIEAVASARPERIHKSWEGLGYYTRVRNLQKAAQTIVERHGGTFPRSFDEVLALPGIGRYTAGAICSIAFNQPTPILDGNTIRVLARLFGLSGNPKEPKVNARLWQIAERLVQAAANGRVSIAMRQWRGGSTRQKGLLSPALSSQGGEGAAADAAAGLPASTTSGVMSQRRRQGGAVWDAGRVADPAPNACSQLNQSLMELGALICTPKQPQCEVCPAASYCSAYRQDRVHELPRPIVRARTTPRRFIALVVERRGRFLVRQRPAGVVNAHLWEFPNIEGALGESVRQVIGSRNAAPEQRASSPRPSPPGEEKGNSPPGMTDYDSELRKAARRLLGAATCRLDSLCTIKHSITRYRITIEVFRAHFEHAAKLAPKEGRWLNRSQLRRLPFASAHKRILEAAVDLAARVQCAPLQQGLGNNTGGMAHACGGDGQSLC